jgi:hypothetical protein
MTAVVDVPQIDDVAPRARARRAGSSLLGTGRTRAGGLLVAVTVLAVVVLCSIAFGSKAISPGTVWQALVDSDGRTTT